MISTALLKPEELRPHECFSFFRAAYLALKILYSGSFTKPILIDIHSRTILDGHHRCFASRLLGLRLVPCHCVDYLAEDSLELHPRRANILVSKADVVRRAREGKRYPYKTTRHVFNVILPPARAFALSELGGTE